MKYGKFYFVARVARETGFHGDVVEEIYDAIIKCMIDVLKRILPGDSLYLFGVGVFKAILKRPRVNYLTKGFDPWRKRIKFNLSVSLKKAFLLTPKEAKVFQSIENSLSLNESNDR